MRSNNRLTAAYVRRHPGDAARVLERLPAAACARLIETLGGDAAVLLAHLPAPQAGAVLGAMDAAAGGAALAAIDPPAAARMLRTAPQLREPLLSRCSAPARLLIERLLAHPANSVGAVMDPVDLALPADLSAGLALKRLKEHPAHDGGQIPVVNGGHRLLGFVDAAALLRSAADQPLQPLARRPEATLLPDMKLGAALAHPGWQRSLTLAVTEADGSLAGLVSYRKLRAAVEADRNARRHTDLIDGTLALAGLYSVAVAETMITLAGLGARLLRRRAG